MEIKKSVVGSWKENSYFISLNNEAWVIDPGQDFEFLRASFKSDEFKLNGIITTHGHFDHVGAAYEFQQHYHIPFYLHASDKRILHQANLYRKLAGDSLVTKTPVIDHNLAELPSVTLGDKVLKVHHTPGHSAGSVCFEIDQVLFSGDLFFPGAIGRTDLPGGDKKVIGDSIRFVLDNFTGYQVYPGHGEPFILTGEMASTLRQLI